MDIKLEANIYKVLITHNILTKYSIQVCLILMFVDNGSSTSCANLRCSEETIDMLAIDPSICIPTGVVGTLRILYITVWSTFIRGFQISWGKKNIVINTIFTGF